jgi:hypothetical protein
METQSYSTIPSGVYIPDPSFCGNKWCGNPGNFPASGLKQQVAQCGDVATMMYQQLTTGGVTGRGVQPCPFGYLQKTPWVDPNGTKILIPYQGKQFNEISQPSIFFDPDRPSFLPPQGNPRPLARIGYEWRNTN